MRVGRSLAVLALSLVASNAPAETMTCTEITALPTVISTGGTYCLKRNLNANLMSGAAITIAANNVVLDCNHRRIGAREAGLGTTATGIYGNQVTNVVISNCSVRGFHRGIWIRGNFVTVENNRLDLNTHGGIDVDAPGSLIRNNTVFDTGGSTATTGTPFGINAVQDSDVIDNMISTVYARTGSGSSVLGIYTYDSDGGTIARNRVRHLLPDGNGTAQGISAGGNNARAIIDGNSINMVRSGGTAAIACTSENSLATDNRVVGVGKAATTVFGCADGGGNRAN